MDLYKKIFKHLLEYLETMKQKYLDNYWDSCCDGIRHEQEEDTLNNFIKYIKKEVKI